MSVCINIKKMLNKKKNNSILNTFKQFKNSCTGRSNSFILLNLNIH